MTIRAIIFDLGNVLDVQDDPAPWQARKTMMAARFGMSAEQLWELFFQTDPWQQVKRGRISYPEYWNRVLSPLGITGKAEQSAFVEELYAGTDVVHPAMAALLRELKPHYKLGLLSNTYEPDLESWLAQRGQGGLFDVIVSSAAEGLAKPEREIYTLTLEKLGVAPAEALFVDDLPRNTIAAEAIGIQCIVFKSPGQLRQALEQRGILPVPGEASRA